MAKKNLLLKNLNDSMLKLKALIGFNVVINYYMDETNLMMLIAFHKIEQYKDWKPLSVQFSKEDFDEEASLLNVKISGLVKQYMEERVKIENQNEEAVNYEQRIKDAVKIHKERSGVLPNMIMLGSDVIKYLNRFIKKGAELVEYEEMCIITDSDILPKFIEVGYNEKYIKGNKNVKAN